MAGHSGDALARLTTASEELAHHERNRALELDAQIASLAMHEPATRRSLFSNSIASTMTSERIHRGARMMLCRLAYRRTWHSDG
jgi:hypothetical protein